MTVRKTDCGSLLVSHLAGVITGAVVVCALVCALRGKKPETLADKAKKAFRTIEDTLSI